MSGEGHLDHSSAVLRQQDELYPLIRDLLRVPTLVIHGLDAAGGRRRDFRVNLDPVRRTLRQWNRKKRIRQDA